MIKELTQAQKDVMPSYVEKWIGIGTSTERLNYDRTVEIVNDYQTHILGKEKVPVILVDNPIEAWVSCCLFDLDKETTPNNVVEKMHRFFDGNPDGHDMPKPEMPYQTGSFFASLFSFYNYFIEQFGYDALNISPDLAHKYEVWQKTSELGMIYPIDQCVIVSQKPTVIHLNENRVLHKDGAPALEYAGRGNFKMYYLNGVKVPKYLAMRWKPQDDHRMSIENKIHDSVYKSLYGCLSCQLRDTVWNYVDYTTLSFVSSSTLNIVKDSVGSGVRNSPNDRLNGSISTSVQIFINDYEYER